MNRQTEQHPLDVYPEPKEQTPLFINEPWLIDKYLFDYGPRNRETEPEEDNIRVYIPLDLNREAILRRLQNTIYKYQEANEDNESDFSSETAMLIEQIAIYDKIWYNRTKEESDKTNAKQHSQKAISLVKEFIKLLESIPDGCAECFPFETIDELKREYEC